MSQETDIAARVEAILEQPIAALGYRLLEIQYRFEGRWTLRVLIDGPEGVTLDDCSAVSELAGRVLDVEDPIPNEFSLEVSSPGIFRPLQTPNHFRQSLGKIARFTLAAEFLTERKARVLRGTIEEVGDATVKVLESGTPVEVPFAGIRNAKLDPDL